MVSHYKNTKLFICDKINFSNRNNLRRLIKDDVIVLM